MFSVWNTLRIFQQGDSNVTGHYTVAGRLLCEGAEEAHTGVRQQESAPSVPLSPGSLPECHVGGCGDIQAPTDSGPWPHACTLVHWGTSHCLGPPHHDSCHVPCQLLLWHSVISYQTMNLGHKLHSIKRTFFAVILTALMTRDLILQMTGQSILNNTNIVLH